MGNRADRISYKHILIFTAAGLILPLCFELLRSYFFGSGAERAGQAVMNVQFVLCPPTVFDGPFQDPNLNKGAKVMGVLVNMSGYSLLGTMVVLGVKKYRWLLYVTGASVLALWVTLIRLI
jgi:hypothetical protein